MPEKLKDVVFVTAKYAFKETLIETYVVQQLIHLMRSKLVLGEK